MQRKPTKNTRGPNSAEKQFQSWLKDQCCVWCGSESGSIVDHVRGATFRHNKVLIGHFFCLPNCEICDKKKTIDGKKLGDYVKKWVVIECEYELATGSCSPDDVYDAIISWGKTWQNG